MTDLVVEFCGHDAARFAVERWHYSGCLPTGKLVKVGVWEAGEFVGAILFSRGASPWLGSAYDLDHVEICELTRIAMRSHEAPVSQAVAGALRLLRQQSPELRLVVSFADPTRGHHGGIYQAGNWIYTGQSDDVDEYFVGGRWRHKKGVWYDLRAKGFNGKNLPENPGGPTVPFRRRPGKYRYLYPLDRAMRRRLAPLALPYPVPRGRGLDGETPASHAGGVGSTPSDRSNTARGS